VDYLRATGKIVLISTHNVAQIGKSADRTLLLSGGKLSAQSEPAAANLGEFHAEAVAEAVAEARLEWLEPAK